MNAENETMPWIVFKIEDKLFSISSRFVQAIIKMPEVNILPNYPEYVKGIIRYRDKIYRLLNLRKILSLNNIEAKIEDFNSMMDARKQDHVEWLTDLENSIHQNREFTKTTDPHKCAFGKWFYSYKTDDITLQEILDKFELPHKKLHGIAIQAEKLKQLGKDQEIESLFQMTRNTTLMEMINLFDQIKVIYRKSLQELAVILEFENHKTAFPVDQVLTVEYLKKIETADIDEKLFELGDTNIFLDVAKSSTDQIVLRLSDEALVRSEFIHSEAQLV